jgi:hypothetical protein
VNDAIQLLVTIACVGLVAWLLTLLPLPAPIGTIIIVVAVVLCVVAVVRSLGGRV